MVEEDAAWRESKEPTRVATVFGAGGGNVTGLRLADLKSALELASICRELAASE